ncbi:MAG: hypothetical protein ACXW36_08765 [Nitrospira sp.]
MKHDHLADLQGFANEVGRRGALGVVAALGFEEGARAGIEDLGLIALDIDDMLDIVELWDPIKQRTAVASLLYYAKHVEKNASLSSRLEQFVATAMKTWRRPGGANEEPSSSS